MKKEHEEQEINWRSKVVNVDVETGEFLTEKQIYNGNYVKVATRVKKTVYKKCGTVECTREYRRSGQLSIWADA